MSQRPWWLGFTLGVVVIVSAMGWVTLTALRLEGEQAAARRQAFREENARLALWRLDSLLTPLVAREAARPAAAYRAFMAPEQAFTRALTPVRRGDVLTCSPLLGANQTEVLVHFQVGPDGHFASPQVPQGAERLLVERDPATAIQIGVHTRRLAELTQAVDRAALLAALDRAPPPRTPAVAERLALGGGKAEITSRSGKELAARNQSYLSNAQLQAVDQQQTSSYGLPRAQAAAPAKGSVEPDQPAVTVMTDIMRPLWLGERLLLARRITIDGGEWVQGCWLDWPLLSLQLHESIADILPEARIIPADGRAGEHRLAALPLVLHPGDVLPDFVPADGDAIPLGATLLLAWGCVALAAAAGAGLVVGALRLSARRGAFVSAVTHELRTPLTTFRLYSDLLAGDMVPDEAERRRCLGTLRTEADRLSHLVENVLAYARLERTTPTRVEPIGVAALLDTARERLAGRATEAGLTLSEEHEPAALARTVRADPQAVERILFNLVDNAAKYAANASDRRLHLEARQDGDAIVISVRDHGPGVPDELRPRMFTPFAKSSEEAARSAPGVGLGLALCRQLARQLGGDLLCAPGHDGARFVLRLPAVPG